MQKIKLLNSCVQGHVLDANRELVEAQIKAYDPMLYLKYEARKGCWEIRRKVTAKRSFKLTEHNGKNVFFLIEHETEFVNHITDVPYLHYDIVKRLKEMDVWANPNYLDEMEYNNKRNQELGREKNRAELRYNLKHNKKAAQYLKEYALAGKNPLKLFM